jgi:AcrR family transcriptional regulator
MYHYFASKEELLSDVVEYHSFLPGLRQILTDTHNRPIETLLAEMAGGFLETLDSKPALVRIFFQEVHSSPSVRNAWADLVHEGVSLLQQFLDSRVAAGELRPTRPRLPPAASSALCSYFTSPGISFTPAKSSGTNIFVKPCPICSKASVYNHPEAHFKK